VESFCKRKRKRFGNNFHNTLTNQSLNSATGSWKVSKSALKYHYTYDCYGTSFLLTEGLSTSPHLPRYLSDRSYDLRTVYIARPLWPLLVSFPLYATIILSLKSHSSPHDNDTEKLDRLQQKQKMK
jgi:hypothetical protein